MSIDCANLAQSERVCVDAEWIKSPTARRVLAHWADARPAWLWSQDGETLLWRNEAARFFHGKVKKRGVKLALISGSFDVVLEQVFPNYRKLFDDVFISRLQFNRSGGLKALEFNHFDVEHKATAVKQIAEREGISLKACVFVGDEFNDLHAIREVGLGIAFNCRDEQVRREADVVIDKKDVREILKYIA